MPFDNLKESICVNLLNELKESECNNGTNEAEDRYSEIWGKMVSSELTLLLSLRQFNRRCRIKKKKPSS